MRVTGEQASGGDALAIAVTDTGPGIAPATMSRLFQKFSQADVSTTREFGGTGLGPAICQDLVRLMGGRVWVESQPGEGATFYAFVPAPRYAGQGTAVDSDLSQDLCGPALKVLAADDNPTNRKVLSTIMDHFGCQLTATENGAEAVDAFDREDFDVIMMDVQTPVMDGVTASRRIREAEATRGPPLAHHRPLRQRHEAPGRGIPAGRHGPARLQAIDLIKLRSAMDQALSLAAKAAAA